MPAVLCHTECQHLAVLWSLKKDVQFKTTRADISKCLKGHKNV